MVPVLRKRKQKGVGIILKKEHMDRVVESNRQDNMLEDGT